MRTGISFTLKSSERRRLKVVLKDRIAPQKQVWRAEIVLLSAEGLGTNEIMRRTRKSKTCVWRWQERFMQERRRGLAARQTRPSRIAPLGPDVVERCPSPIGDLGIERALGWPVVRVLVGRNMTRS